MRPRVAHSHRALGTLYATTGPSGCRYGQSWRRLWRYTEVWR
jgi:hypothetical protein